jgi:hypothetical protein
MATGPITKTNVDALTCPPSKDREILWDSDHREAVRGFGIAAFRNGGKCYIAQYRKDGRSRRTRIGEHGRLTPEEARRQARMILGLVEKGSDPIEERRKGRAVRTFRQVAEEWLTLTSRRSGKIARVRNTSGRCGYTFFQRSAPSGCRMFGAWTWRSCTPGFVTSPTRRTVL